MKTQPTATRHTGKAKFGEALRKLRKAADLSVVDLAKKAGIDPTLLSRIETGARLPPELRTLIELTRALGIPQSSQQFEELWTLFEQERHPGQDATEYIATMKDLTVVALKHVLADLDTTSMHDGVPLMPVFVEDVAGLVARSNEEAVRRGATAITVRFGDGTSKRWQLLPKDDAGEQHDV